MKAPSKRGIVRRPLEYFLWAVAALLIVILLVSLNRLKKESGRALVNDEPATVQLTGEVEDIDKLTEQASLSEMALDKEYDEEEKTAASSDAAADSFSEVFDEADL